MRLDLYFARRFLTTFLGLLLLFLAFYALLDMVEQLRKYDAQRIGFFGILHLTALNVPAGLYRILPLVVILATIALFLNLARKSELVVTRAAGRSALRSLASPVIVAFLLGALSVATVNPIVAATTKQYELVANRYSEREESVLSISKEGLWLRQGNQDGQTVIRAERSNLDGTHFFGVSFVGFTPDGAPAYRIEAESALLNDGAWQLTNAKRWDLRGAEIPEQGAQTQSAMTIPSDLTPDRIRDSFGTPSAIPIWELPAFIDRLEQAGFSARQHRVWLQMELALPLMLSAMVLVGAGFTMRHTRFGRTGLMVLFAVLLGFAIYFVRNFAQILGENGQIPVLLAAWAPPAAAILMTLGLLLHLEDG